MNIGPTPARRTLAVLACSAATLLAAGSTGAVAAPKTCHQPKYPSSGYFTRITASGVSCGMADKVTLAYYRCRTHSGQNLAGRCTSRVLGFRCTEEPRQSIGGEFLARATCRRHGATVVTVYQQDL